MDVEKKKMDPEKKVKLIYSGELLLFSVVFLILGILEVTKVIHISKTFSLIFRWVTIFGGAWMIADFLWALFSKKRQKKISMVDKIVLLPLGIYLIVYDIIGFVTNPDIDVKYAFYQFGMSSPFFYITLIYAFEGIYHWFYPVPGLFDDIQKEDNAHEVVQEVEPIEEQPKEEENKNE